MSEHLISNICLHLVGILCPSQNFGSMQAYREAKVGRISTWVASFWSIASVTSKIAILLLGCYITYVVIELNSRTIALIRLTNAKFYHTMLLSTQTDSSDVNYFNAAAPEEIWNQKSITLNTFMKSLLSFSFHISVLTWSVFQYFSGRSSSSEIYCYF